ncbi:TonB-dependent receptor [Rhodopirellula sp. JC740]|uniref:TonB-dependent receptor n=1 Tax=Rhodopirellula halodulae TaxID=2894198 RepID=A0ABS8NPC0_9BACT|nr:TonB-dependent receptor [Rhodopirellula sp. JC740]MCC9645345.1 TonB-dependent receptor [Rhodopirellula sp. JC740]
MTPSQTRSNRHSSWTVSWLVSLMAVALCTNMAMAQNPKPLPVGRLQAPVTKEALAVQNEKSNDELDDEAALKADARVASLFGDVNQVKDLPPDREPLANSPAADAVFREEALGRRTADIGDLLRRSKGAHGVSIQNRTPIVSDTRVRGQRVGQVLASGSYWTPARMDLDTMMSKIDSRLIQDSILIKGPYASRYGPGFRFVDLEFLQSPRYENGYEGHGATSGTYNTNGEQFYGRQSFWGGAEDYGFHLSYGHRTGNDYETGQDGFFIPASYKSRDLFVAFGFDLNENERIEWNALRLDQTDVEFPGLVTDLNFLVTDGYEVTYVNEAPGFADYFTSEVWYNRTRFEGDTTRPGKARQIPTLVDAFQPSFLGADDGFTNTDGDALSAGYRFESTFFSEGAQWSIGTDLIYLNQELNEYDFYDPDPNDNNFPIPRSDSIDVGLYAERIVQATDDLVLTAGTRIDGVFTDSRDIVQGVPAPLSELEGTTLDKEFFLGSAYLTANRNLGRGWIGSAGMGFAMRQPTLTEMYAEYTFIGSLQRGLTFLDGDPLLSSEKLYQLDLGVEYNDDRVQFGLHGHHAWVQDFITYDLFDPAGTIDGFQQGASFVNTDLATLMGFETYGQVELSSMLSLFGILTYVEGRDRTRLEPSRHTGDPYRSGNSTVDAEPLPGIAPMEARTGVLIHDPQPSDRWGVELAARIVDNQDRVATTLQEIETPGFTVYDIRTYRRFGSLLVTSGFENVTDKFYREHIDYRSGLGVYRPGFGFYVGAELTY